MPLSWDDGRGMRDTDWRHLTKARAPDIYWQESYSCDSVFSWPSLALVRVELCLDITFRKLSVTTGKFHLAVFTYGEQWVFMHNPNLSLEHGRTPHEQLPLLLFSSEAQRPSL
jgi:hypothetical protein